MRKLFTILCCIISLSSIAQQKAVQVVVTDSLHNPVIGATIRVQRISNNSIVLYQYIRDTNIIELKLPVHSSDSLLMTVQSSGYRPQYFRLLVSDSLPISFTATLYLQQSTLQNIVVHGPPVWRRGDTTFYKVEAFKSGEERKLKDIIEKLPDFSFDKNGSLMYKQQAVEKIMIDGEELFAQRMDLLLTSFPVHVLDQIQALENQSSQKLLKGLSGESKVFINLKLNDKKLQAAFGDISLALGLPWRYQFSPVLFAMRSKLQVGIISNFNNLGEGFGWKAQDELKTDPQKKLENWLMQNPSLQTINNFDSRYYILNKLADNRLQANATLSKKVKLKQEFSYTVDRQQQSSFYSSILISSSNSFARKDSNYFESNPRIIVSNTEITYQPKPNTELKTQVILALNNSSINQQSSFTLPDNTYQQFGQGIRNNWKQLVGLMEFTHRVSDNKALKLWALASQVNLPQTGTGISSQFYEIYQLPNQQFNNQQVAPNLLSKVLNAGAVLFSKAKQKTNQYHLEAGYASYNYSSNAFFWNNDNTDTVDLSPLINKQFMEILHANLQTSRSIEFGKTLFAGSGKVGLQSLHMTDQLKMTSPFVVPTLNFDISSRTKLARSLRSSLLLTYNQELATPSKMYLGVLPTGISQFYRFLGYNSMSMQKLFILASIAFDLPRQHSQQLSVSRNFLFRSSAFYNNYDGFVQTIIDSATNGNTSSTQFAYTYNYNHFKRNFRISSSIGYSISSRLYIIDGKTEEGTSDLAYMHISFHKTWQKRWFYYIECSYNKTTYELPAAFNAKNISKTQNMSIKSRITWNVTKPISMNVYGAWYNNNLGTANNFNFTILDTEIQYKPIQKNYYFSIKVRNLANVSSFKELDLNPFSQNISTIPILPRNILFGFYFNL